MKYFIIAYIFVIMPTIKAEDNMPSDEQTRWLYALTLPDIFSLKNAVIQCHSALIMRDKVKFKKFIEKNTSTYVIKEKLGDMVYNAYGDSTENILKAFYMGKTVIDSRDAYLITLIFEGEKSGVSCFLCAWMQDENQWFMRVFEPERYQLSSDRGVIKTN